MDEIRVITWTVSDDGLELLPEAPQFGGVQGEENAALVRFAIGESCPLAQPEYSLYIEAVDATGAWDRTDRLSIVGGYVSYTVPLAWTQHGGHTTLRLQAERDGQTVYTLAGVLRFDNRATAARGRMTVFRTLIQEALEQLRAARAEFMASIEDHLDDTSENPVQNKVVTNEIRHVEELATDNGNRITAVSKRVSDLEVYSDDIGRIREISERVSAVEDESLPDLEKRLTHVEDTMPIVDRELSATSENPVQNKAVNEAIGNIDQRLYALEQNGGSGVTVDPELDPESENPVQNKVVADELAALQEYADRINEVAAQAEQVVREMNQDVTWLMGHEQAISDLQGYEHRITVLEGSVVKHTAQTLTEAQKQQARANIGAVSDSILNALQDIEQILIPAMEERIDALEDAAITVDDELDATSANPVENRVIVGALADMGKVADEAQGTAADAKSIANAAANTASNAQSAANNALNKAVNVESSLSETDGNVEALDGRVKQVEEGLSEVAELVNDFNGDLGDHGKRIAALEGADVVSSVNGMTGAVNLTAQDVGARPNTWTPTCADVGAESVGTAAAVVSTHNTNTDAHNDIRLLITALTKRLDALANSDDTTLDQMAEVVAYIKANRGLIEQVTTGKVSVADIVNNLTTNVTDKPLSAAQGVALKALIDELAAAANSIASIAKTATNGLVDTYTITYTNGTKSTYTVTNGADGAAGERGTGLLYVTTAPSSYTTVTGGFTPVYRIALSTVLTQAKVSKVLVGDMLSYSYYRYPVGYVDASYVYLGTRKSVRGATGTSVTVSGVSESTESGGENVVTFSDGKTLAVKNGRDGENGTTPAKGTDYFTEADKTEIVADVIASLTTETWTFTLEDGSTVTKKVVLA